MSLTKDAIAIALLSFLTCSGGEIFGQSTSTWTGATSTWNLSTNWNPATVPGSMTSSLDTAIFTTTASSPISLDAMEVFNPGLNQLQLSHSGSLTIDPGMAGNYIQFNPLTSPVTEPLITVSGGGSTTLDTPITVNATTLNFAFPDVSALTLTQPISPNGTSSLVVSGSSGTLTFQASSGASLAGSYTQSGATVINNNATLAYDQNFNLSGGSYTNSNTNAPSSGNEALSSSSADFIVTGGTLTNSSTATGTITGTGIGANCRGATAFTINDGTVISSNTGTIDGTDAKGAFLGAIDPGATFNINGGTVQLTNSGTIGPTNGFNFGSDCLSAGTFNITGGTVECTNSGTITAPTRRARGIDLRTSNSQDLNISGGTINATNTNSGSITSTGLGVAIYADGALAFSGGTINATNNGPVSIMSGSGNGIRIEGNTAFVVSGGIINATNNGSIGSGGSGVVLICDTAGASISGGAIHFINSDSGAIANGSVGTYFYNAGPASLNGGDLTFDNRGPVLTGSFIPAGCYSFTNGAFTVNNGSTLVMSNSGSIADTGNGCLFENVGTFTLDQGAFTLTNTGSGTVTSGAGARVNTNGNDFLFNSGTIALSNSQAISGSSTRGAIIESMGNGDFTMSGGTLTLDNSGTITSTSGTYGTYIAFKNFTLNSGSATLSNSGAISGTTGVGSILRGSTGVTINGGTLTINANTGSVAGTNTSGSRLEGGTSITVNGGTLVNHDTVQTPALTVGAAGNLAGRGTFANPSSDSAIAILNAGTITPGNPGIGASSPGTLTIQGEYTQTASGTFAANILNSTNYSKLSVTAPAPGTTALAGTLQVSVLPGATISPTDVFTIVQTPDNSTGVSGTFTLVNNTPYFQPTITYLADAVQLSFTTSTPTLVANFSQTILSNINETHFRLGRQMVYLRSRFDHGRKTELAASMDPATQFLASNEELAKNNRAPVTKTACSPREKAKTPWNLYLGPTGNFGEVFSKGNQVGFDYWSAGALVGFDYAFSQAGVGLLLDYNHISGKTQAFGDFLIDETHMSLYGTYSPDRAPELSFNGVVGGSCEWYEIQRKVPTYSIETQGKPEGAEFDALLGMEYTFENRRANPTRDVWKFIPLASLQYTYLKVDSYDEENGGIFGLHIDEQKVQSLQTILGSRLNYTWNRTSSQKITTELDFSWQREFLNRDQSLAFSPLTFNQPNSALIIPGSGRNLFILGIDCSALYSEKYGWEASYDFQISEDYRNHNFYVGFQANF